MRFAEPLERDYCTLKDVICDSEKPLEQAIIKEVVEEKKTVENVVMQGEATYYSRAGCIGCSPKLLMANGQPLDDGALTFAVPANRMDLLHKKFTIENAQTGKKVMAMATDTGGVCEIWSCRRSNHCYS